MTVIYIEYYIDHLFVRNFTMVGVFDIRKTLKTLLVWQLLLQMSQLKVCAMNDAHGVIVFFFFFQAP